MIGDFDPEDAWHPRDAVDVQAYNLGRRVALLDGGPTPIQVGDEVADHLDVVEARLAPFRQRPDLTPREAMRVYLLIADLAFVRDRLAGS